MNSIGNEASASKSKIEFSRVLFVVPVSVRWAWAGHLRGPTKMKASKFLLDDGRESRCCSVGNEGLGNNFVIEVNHVYFSQRVQCQCH
jgi:hypothetical protein